MVSKNKSSPTSINGSDEGQEESSLQRKREVFGINRVRSIQMDIDNLEDSPDNQPESGTSIGRSGALCNFDY